MRIYFIFLVTIAVLLSSVTSTFADDGIQHGKPTVGHITALSAEGFVVASHKGDVRVSVQKETQFTTGDGTVKTEMRPQVGDHVLVYGTKLENGSLVAEEITIHRVKSVESGSKHGGMKMEHMDPSMGEHAGHNM